MAYSSFSQTKDTIYYDKYWGKTVKDKALFYRPLPLKKVGDLYVLKDYYMDGNLQMKGFSTSLKDDVFNGKTTWYYQNGQKMLEQTFDKGKIIGNEKSYFKDGTLMSSGLYQDGIKYNGTFYLSHISQDKTSTVINGILKSYNTYYESTKTIARQTIYGKNRVYENSIYLSKKGDTIATTKEYNKNTNNFTGYSKVYFKANTNANIVAIVFLTYQEFKNNILTVFLKDSNLNTIATGIYKDGKPFRGQFFQDNKLVTYKERILDGEATFYDDEFNAIAKGVYKNGLEHSGSFYVPYSKEIQKFENGKIVSKVTKNKYTNETYECTFENYTPINGDYFSSTTLESYKNGKRIKQIDFDYDTGKKEKITYYENGDYLITKVIFFKNSQELELHYKEGVPYQGKEFTSFGYHTYKNGVSNGPFLIEDQKVTVKGNYIENFKMDGEIIYIRKQWKDTLRCVFNNGKPLNGSTYDLGNLTTYKDGEKEGCGYKTFNNYRYAYDSLQICYNKDRPIGKASYYLKNTLVAVSEYKNGIPYNGTFFKFQNKKIYKAGTLIEKHTARGYKYNQQEFFDKSLPVKTIFRDYDSGDIKYIVEFKKGKPYKGTQMVYDSINRLYIETSYANGKKDGLETTYKYLHEGFISKYTFKNGKKNGYALFNVKFSDTTFRVNYLDEKPIEGTLIEYGKDFVTKSVFKNAKIISRTYYTISAHKKMCSITYKDDKPFTGMELEYLDKKRIVKKYSNGKLVKTYFGAYRFLDAQEPNATCKIYHYASKDSVVSGSSYKPIHYLINYIPKSKRTSGTITFSKNDTITGTASFKKSKLKAFNYKIRNVDGSTETIKLQANKLFYVLEQEEFKAQFFSDYIKIDLPIYKSIYSIINGQLGKATVDLFLDSKEPLSQVILKDGKPYDGIFFMPEKELYSVYKVNKGARDVRFLRLTKQELIEKIKELQRTNN